MKATMPDGSPILIDGKPTQILFTYGEAEATLGGEPTTVREVECVIRPFPAENTEDPTPFSTGVAQCSPLDNFDRTKGRFLAWKRAIGNQYFSRFTKEQRTDLWSWFVSCISLPKDNNF